MWSRDGGYAAFRSSFTVVLRFFFASFYLLTYSAIRIRVVRRWQVSRGRFVAALLLLLLLPIATMFRRSQL